MSPLSLVSRLPAQPRLATASGPRVLRLPQAPSILKPPPDLFYSPLVISSWGREAVEFPWCVIFGKQ